MNKEKLYTIYKATNIVNSKSYIGFTQNFQNRIKNHKKASENYAFNSDNKSAFYEAIIKYGWDNFSWEILYQSKHLNHAKNEMEPFFILEYNSYCGFKNSNGYNLTLGGDGSNGRKCKKSTKQKLKKWSKSHYENPENRERQRQFAIDWWDSLTETEKNIHAQKSRHEVPWNKGKRGEYNFSDKTRKKISESKMGHPSYERTEIILDKLRKNRKGKGTGKNNAMAKEENRRKVGLSKIGRKKYINPISLEKKYCIPGTQPEGFVIIKKS